MIDKKQIKKVASLAKINISDDELNLYEHQISKILEYIDQLNNVDTTGVEEFSNKLFDNNKELREDKKDESLSRETITKLAPKSDGVYIEVPQVIKEKE